MIAGGPMSLQHGESGGAQSAPWTQGFDERVGAAIHIGPAGSTHDDLDDARLQYAAIATSGNKAGHHEWQAPQRQEAPRMLPQKAQEKQHQSVLQAQRAVEIENRHPFWLRGG